MAAGRPREFCTEAALDEALKVFWRLGYEGTSLTHLTDAMGITRPSLYAAFGNKEDLFRKALDRYSECRWGFAEGALAEPTSKDAVRHLLEGFAGFGASEDFPRGCLFVQAALVCSPESEAIRSELARRRAEGEARLVARLDAWRDEGDLPPDADVAGLASIVVTLANGLSVQAAGGTDPGKLRSVIEFALAAWPEPPAPAAEAAPLSS